MNFTLRYDLGCTEAVLHESGSLHDFQQAAHLLDKNLGIKFHYKQDDFDGASWDFKYKGHQLRLQYNVYHGISVYPAVMEQATEKDNKTVEYLLHKLQGKADKKLQPQHTA
jgi:hypothetical protein